MRARVPPYFDGLIEGFHAGQAGRDVHLGFWDDPPALSTPCRPGEFETAQARLTDIMLDLSDLADGQDVVDVGCGFGGALAAMGRRARLTRVGVNIDPRQLDICRTLLQTGSPLSLVAADACALPFASASFDRVVCVEAMFHFRSRSTFLGEAARLLRRGGRLAVSDILLRKPPIGAPMRAADIATIIQREYGPWPRPWIDEREIIEDAQRAGLVLTSRLDATRATLPTYRVTAPQNHAGFPQRPNAGNLLRWLHVSGGLQYLCLAFAKA